MPNRLKRVSYDIDITSTSLSVTLVFQFFKVFSISSLALTWQTEIDVYDNVNGHAIAKIYL